MKSLPGNHFPTCHSRRPSCTSTYFLPRYFIWFMVPSIMCNLLIPLNNMSLQTMILAGNLTVFFKHAGRYSSPDFRRSVCTRSSSTAMVDSSVNITWNKEIKPCSRLSVCYEGIHHWLFLNSFQSILSNNFGKESWLQVFPISLHPLYI